MNTKTIAVVEDDEAIASLIASVLEEFLGHRTIIIGDGRQAFETIRLTKPNAVLLDLALPGMDGQAVFDRLKVDRETARIPVIFVTVHQSRHEALRQRGSRWFLSKPFELDDLLTVVNEALASIDSKAA